MGIFDKIKDQLRGSKGKDISDAAEKKINEKTGNKYTDQVDSAQKQAEDRFGIGGDDPKQ
ncbi:Rv0909 family putative TA system antitoxin [Streptomyces sp. NPDC048441]|uniref:Rv0909 family putative TA system antitoxin n=1 Tax=Streptomyces sp. NPDC048441 TaxID=3365552 RepID=UPI003713F3EF